MVKQVVLTYEGLEKLEAELDYLKTHKRKEVANTIKQAMDFGDLSENAEYDEAKNEQAQMEMRIAYLENLLKNAKVIDDEDIDLASVSLGSKVKILDIDFNEEVEYTIVGSTEAEPSNFKISDESPLGAALLGKKPGDEVSVCAPSGDFKVKVISIGK